LSLFNRQLKTKPVDDAEGDSEESTDAVFMDLEIEGQLDMLETEVNGEGLGDEDPDIDSDDDLDEIAGDVAASDAAAVTEVIQDAEASIRLDPLPLGDANIGRVSIAKVSTT